MTDKEKAIVMAHTGICMLSGEKFGVFHAYIEDIMGRPVYTHELAIQSISDEIKEKSRDDFIKLCMEEQEPCEDAISRKSIKQKLQEHHDFFVNAHGGFSNLPLNDKSRVDEITNCIAMVVNEPPVTPQPKRCKNCKWWKDNDGVFRRGVGAESQCPINQKEVYEGNGYCFMYDPQKSEE